MRRLLCLLLCLIAVPALAMEPDAGVIEPDHDYYAHAYSNEGVIPGPWVELFLNLSPFYTGTVRITLPGSTDDSPYWDKAVRVRLDPTPNSDGTFNHTELEIIGDVIEGQLISLDTDSITFCPKNGGIVIPSEIQTLPIQPETILPEVFVPGDEFELYYNPDTETAFLIDLRFG